MNWVAAVFLQEEGLVGGGVLGPTTRWDPEKRSCWPRLETYFVQHLSGFPQASKPLSQQGHLFVGARPEDMLQDLQGTRVLILPEMRVRDGNALKNGRQNLMYQHLLELL